MFKQVCSVVVSALILTSSIGYGQTPATAKGPSEVVRHQEGLGAELEEIAMCHHAILAARHEAISLNQNAYFRYIINSPRKNSDQNIYPIPVVASFSHRNTADDAEGKTGLEKVFANVIGATPADIAADVQFLTKVILYKERDDWNKLDAPDAIQ